MNESEKGIMNRRTFIKQLSGAAALPATPLSEGGAAQEKLKGEEYIEPPGKDMPLPQLEKLHEKKFRQGGTMPRSDGAKTSPDYDGYIEPPRKPDPAEQ